jgi:predicted DNA-binding transcriptional regulator AlpA
MTASIPKALAAFDSLPDSAHVDVRAVAGLFGCSVPTVWRRAGAALLPAPRKFGSQTRWNVGELRAVLAQGIA